MSDALSPIPQPPAPEAMPPRVPVRKNQKNGDKFPDLSQASHPDVERWLLVVDEELAKCESGVAYTDMWFSGGIGAVAGAFVGAFGKEEGSNTMLSAVIATVVLLVIVVAVGWADDKRLKQVKKIQAAYKLRLWQLENPN